MTFEGRAFASYMEICTCIGDISCVNGAPQLLLSVHALVYLLYPRGSLLCAQFGHALFFCSSLASLTSCCGFEVADILKFVVDNFYTGAVGTYIHT